MKQLYLNLKKGELRVRLETTDDLWLLSQIVEHGDATRGKTERKIKLGSGDERAKVIKKVVFVEIDVEKVEFSGAMLRISGKTAEEKEGIPRGSYHSFTLEPGDEITIIKKEWLSYQLGKIRDACSSKLSKILICVFDREIAFFALLKKVGFDFLSELKGEVQKKNFEVKSRNFYLEIIAQLEEYDRRYELDHIIVASPAFWKEDLMKELKNNDLRKKIILATTSSAGKEAFDEVVKRKEVESVLKEDITSNEMKVVDRILEEISKNGKVAYGLKEVEELVNNGAVETIVLTEEFIKEKRELNQFKHIDALMRITEKLKGIVKIISSSNEAGKKLDSLGGIAALLRYKLKYD